MKAHITSFKESGKWYDEFDIDIPEDTKLYDSDLVMSLAYMHAPQLKNYYFIVKIDEPKASTWFWRMFKPLNL